MIQSDFFTTDKDTNDEAINLVEINAIGGHKVRVRIRSTAKPGHSFAVAEVWAGYQWNQITGRDASFMTCKPYWKQGEEAEHRQKFQDDANALREIARKILL